MDDVERARIVRYRWIQLAMALVLAAVVLLGVVYGSAGGTANNLPTAIQALSPVDGSQVPHQIPIVIDMAPGYDITISVRRPSSDVWEQVPPSEVRFESATGVFTWAPSPLGFLGDLGSGDYRLRVEYRGTGTTLDAGSYEWSIRTY